MKKITAILLTLLMALLCMTMSVGAAQYNGISQVIHVNATAKNIVIDGKIDGDEWGKPIISTTPEKIMENYNLSWNYSGDKKANADQRVDIYVTNDGGSLYVACKVTNTDYNDSAPDVASLRNKYPHFGFTMANYDDTNVVKSKIYQEKTYEMFGHFGIGLVEGNKECATKTQGNTAKKLYKADYEIGYDSATRSYVYEVCVAEDLTPVDITVDSLVVMSFDIGCMDNGKYGAYTISDVAPKVWMGQGGAGKFVHRKAFPLLVVLNTTADLAKPEFVPTQQEAGLNNEQQDGYTDVADAYFAQNQDAAWTPITVAAVSLAGVAVLMIVVTVTVLLIGRKRR